MSSMTLETLPQVPDCSSVSQLPPLDEHDRGASVLSSDTLLLVSLRQSDKKYETDSNYLSRQAKLSEIAGYLSSQFNLEKVWFDISQKVDLSDMQVTATLSIDTTQPYVLSSFYIDRGIVKSLSGYPLSLGLQTAIDKNGYIPSRLSTAISYDDEKNVICLKNFDNTIKSEINRDAILDDLIQDRTLSNVTISEDNAQLYLHFINEKNTLRKVALKLRNFSAPYDFVNGVKLTHSNVKESRLSVTANYDEISAELGIYQMRQQINDLQAKLNELSNFVMAMNPILLEQ